MQPIDKRHWKRKAHFDFFRGMDYPHFNICADVTVTALFHTAKEKRISMFLAVLYAVSRAVNSVEELRCRIRGEDVVVHPLTHPSFTIMGEENLFGFCYVEYTEAVDRFFASAQKAMARSRERISLEDLPKRDDFIFISTLPWVRFTGISHPIHMHPADSVPRITWGRYDHAGGRVVMPLSIQVHHGLADGCHIGRFYETLQGLMDDPGTLLEPLFGGDRRTP